MGFLGKCALGLKSSADLTYPKQFLVPRSYLLPKLSKKKKKKSEKGAEHQTRNYLELALNPDFLILGPQQYPLSLRFYHGLCDEIILKKKKQKPTLIHSVDLSTNI